MAEALPAGLELAQDGALWRGRFTAMACPCEALIDTPDRAVAARAATAVAEEAWRVEHKFSRYRDDNLVHAINHAEGEPVTVDEECARLLDFAAECWELSDGLFDITSGVLRQVWKFDGSDRLPDPKAVREAMQRVGWHKAEWRAPVLRLEPGMEIDFGGIGKEYAVDRAAELGHEATGGTPLLVNFGGDIYASGPRRDGSAWAVAIESVVAGEGAPRIELRRGGVATSGDARRFLLKDGARYGHILDPRSGWPVKETPRSVTVLEANCTNAGLLSTLAILQGAGAEDFLKDQEVTHWVMR
ncbi:MAG TPA: FAD:protein FMN transferase [Gammaproteobacteria bacterium]|jgi:thiamine biosynthesis lipoprotein